MIIEKTNPFQYNSKKVSTPNFKSVVAPKTARFNLPTIRVVDTILNGYKDILTKLDRKTPEGIKFLQEHYPDITIGESLIFHNCGKDKSSILIYIAEGLKNKGLTRIIERQGASSWGNRILKNSFTIEYNDKLIKNEDKENHVNFPKERIYYTEDEVEKENLEETLKTVLEDLDFAMLKFRIFLNKNNNMHTKIPTGKLSSILLSNFSHIDNLTSDIHNTLKTLPPKVSLEARHLYENYKMNTGSPTITFQNIGEENLSISYHSFNSKLGENFKRLSVYDSSDKLLRTLVITEDGKIIKNHNQNFETALPDKPIFADEKEILSDEYKPTLEKYLNLYKEELTKFHTHIKKFSTNRFERLHSEPLVLPETNQVLIKSISDNIIRIQAMFSNFDANSVAYIKKTIIDLFAPPGRKGITFTGFQGDKSVYFLPVKSNTHSGLTRLTIINADNSEEIYLIKDGKHIVKNFNPKYPQIIPPNLIYANQSDTPVDLSEALDFINKKSIAYKNVVSEFLENKSSRQEKIKEERQLAKQKAQEKNNLKKEKKEAIAKTRQEEKSGKEKIKNNRAQKVIQKQEKSAKQEIIKLCREKISELGKNINSSNESFNSLLKELQDKISQFLEK